MSLLHLGAGPSDPADLFSSTSTAFDNPYVEWLGAYDDNNAATLDRRRMQNNHNFVAMRVKGTQCRVRYSSDGSQPFNISVDGGAYSTPTGSGGYVTLFTGLSDSWHDVLFKSGSAYANSAYIYKTNTWDITGANPRISFNTSFGGKSEIFCQSSFQTYGIVTPGSSAVAVASPTYPSIVVYRGFDATFFRNVKASEVFLQHLDGSSGNKYTLAANGTKIATVATSTGIGFTRLGYLDPGIVSEIAITCNGASGSVSAFGVFLRGGSGFVNESISTKKKLCCFGDSITQATTSLGESTIGYCYKLSLANNYQPINRGIAGDTVAQMLARISSVNSTAPDYVIVLGGRNNWGSSVQADYESILNSLLTNTSAKILAVDTFNPGGTGGASRTTTNNSILAAVNAVNNSRILHVNTDSLTSIGTFDGTHPNDAGYDAIVSFLQPFVTSHFV